MVGKGFFIMKIYVTYIICKSKITRVDIHMNISLIKLQKWKWIIKSRFCAINFIHFYFNINWEKLESINIKNNNNCHYILAKNVNSRILFLSLLLTYYDLISRRYVANVARFFNEKTLASCDFEQRGNRKFRFIAEIEGAERFLSRTMSGHILQDVRGVSSAMTSRYNKMRYVAQKFRTFARQSSIITLAKAYSQRTP